MNDYKRCPNGHYYQGATCPYCKNVGGSNTSSSTVLDPLSGGIGVGVGAGENGETATKMVGGFSDEQKTTVVGGLDAPVENGVGGGNDFGKHTVFVDDEQGEQKVRNTRKLVGWLVTYSLDPMGVDFKLYEGRNVLGRDMDCNITINDKLISGKHAIVLFRSGKFSITDQQSSHGTVVNGEDIELEPHYLKDGDIIRLGNTVFMIRMAMFDAGKF
jgi:hypothetical protein